MDNLHCILLDDGQQSLCNNMMVLGLRGLGRALMINEAMSAER